MASEGLILDTPSPSFPSLNKAKRYNRSKLITSLISSGLSFVLLGGLVASGATKGIEEIIRTVAGNDYIVLTIFGLAIVMMLEVIALPMSFFSGYVLEHRFLLSNQTMAAWGWERCKSMLISFPLMLGAGFVVYYCLLRFGTAWWVPVGIVLTLFSVVAVRLAPTLLFPLFYRFTPLEQGELFHRIMGLCRKAGVECKDIFTFNLSKNTKKANAGFTGIGRSRRIILSDTLLKGFADEEIETVFAHELGHRVYRHIAKGIVTGTLFTFAELCVAAWLFRWCVPILGFTSESEIASLPLLVMSVALVGFVTGFLGKAISRSHEREADAFAVRMTGRKDAFLSALRKLSDTNLSDPEPHPIVEFLFYSHPSIAHRLRAVETMTV